VIESECAKHLYKVSVSHSLYSKYNSLDFLQGVSPKNTQDIFILQEKATTLHSEVYLVVGVFFFLVLLNDCITLKSDP